MLLYRVIMMGYQIGGACVNSFFKKITVIIGCWSLGIISVEAALPPFYQSLNEYRALLNSPELAKKLGSVESIQEIQRTDSGFIITTTKHTMDVDIIFDPQNHPGPAQFHFFFHDLDNGIEKVD
jgi:hypothetical protein